RPRGAKVPLVRVEGGGEAVEDGGDARFGIGDQSVLFRVRAVQRRLGTVGEEGAGRSGRVRLDGLEVAYHRRPIVHINQLAGRFALAVRIQIRVLDRREAVVRVRVPSEWDARRRDLRLGGQRERGGGAGVAAEAAQRRLVALPR